MRFKLVSGVGLALVLSLVAIGFVSMQPKAYASPCTDAATAVFRSQQAVATQHMVTGTITNNQQLVRQGSTELTNAIITYNAALLRCSSLAL
jgi:hypothetical protein